MLVRTIPWISRCFTLILGVSSIAYAHEADVPNASDRLRQGERIERRVKLEDVLSNLPGEEGNAASLYVEAIRLYEGRRIRGQVKEIAEDSWKGPQLSPDELALLTRAAGIRSCDFQGQGVILQGRKVFLEPLTDITEFQLESQAAVFRRLRSLVRGLVIAGLRNERLGRAEDALRYYEAVIKLGTDLFRGRSSLAQTVEGITFESIGCHQAVELFAKTGEPQRAQVYSQYEQDGRRVLRELYEKYTFIWMTCEPMTAYGFPRQVSPSAGSSNKRDAIWTLLNDEDPMFRREAAFALRVLVSTKEDESAYEALRTAAENDSDVSVREAARNALRQGEVVFPKVGK